MPFENMHFLLGAWLLLPGSVLSIGPSRAGTDPVCPQTSVFDADCFVRTSVTATGCQVLYDLGFLNIDGHWRQDSTERIPSPPTWIVLPNFLFLGLHTKCSISRNVHKKQIS